MTTRTPRIAPSTKYVAAGKQWSLDPNLAPKDIAAALKRKVRQDDHRSGDGKVKHSWKFTVDGDECSIWDYYGVRWSASGPERAFRKLGLELFQA